MPTRRLFSKSRLCCICERLCICQPNEKWTIFAPLRIKSNVKKLKYTSVSSGKKRSSRKSMHYSTVRKYFVILPDMRSWTCLVLFGCSVLQYFNFLPISLLWLSYIMHNRAPRSRRVCDFTSCLCYKRDQGDEEYIEAVVTPATKLCGLPSLSIKGLVIFSVI